MSAAAVSPKRPLMLTVTTCTLQNTLSANDKWCFPGSFRRSYSTSRRTTAACWTNWEGQSQTSPDLHHFVLPANTGTQVSEDVSVWCVYALSENVNSSFSTDGIRVRPKGQTDGCFEILLWQTCPLKGQMLQWNVLQKPTTQQSASCFSQRKRPLGRRYANGMSLSQRISAVALRSHFSTCCWCHCLSVRQVEEQTESKSARQRLQRWVMRRYCARGSRHVLQHNIQW